MRFPRPGAEFKIVFVCSGNTCRSPLAAAAWRAFASPIFAAAPVSIDPPAIIVASAGLNAGDGAPASPYTIAIARDWGIDLSSHRARRLTSEIAGASDLICTMTASQAVTVRAHFDLGLDNVWPLGTLAPLDDAAADNAAQQGRLADLLETPALKNLNSLDADRDGDILDPYGGSIEAYQTCAEQIRRAALGLARALRCGPKSL